ncbi:MAG: HAD-IB family hydrolase [Candidatus Nanopelagicales bacterium]|nr:HAD-IB family hydrolase [Candidatus Nanopelagicales bacterium]
MNAYAPSAAFFDLDRTLIRGSANFALAWEAFKAGQVPKRQLAKDAVNALSFIFAGASDNRSERLRERILRAIAGVPVVDLESLGDRFIPRLARTVMPEARTELDRQAAAGRDRIIVSASPIEIVGRLAKMIGMEGAVATTAEITDGRYTGQLVGPFCYGEGKVAAIEQLASERGYDLNECVAYSDSISDLPLLESVGEAVVINPDRELRKIAPKRGWRIVEVGKRASRAARRATPRSLGQ